MKINSKIFFFLSILIFGFTEFSVGQQKNVSKFSVGVFYYPAKNNYKVFGDTNYGDQAKVVAHTAQNFGILGSYGIGRRFSVQSGIGLSDYGYDMEYSGRGYDKGLYLHKVTYLEVPLELTMILNSGNRVQLIGSLGGSSSFFLRKYDPYYATGHQQTNYSNFDNFTLYSKTLFGINAGVGIRYNYSDHISLALQPLVKFVLTKNTHSPFSWDDEWTHVSCYGLRVFLNYKF